MRTWLAATVILCTGCPGKLEPAPLTMEESAKFLYQNYDDPELVATGMADLAAWLDTNGVTEEAEDGFEVSPITPEIVAAVEYADRDVSTALGAAVAGPSPHAIELHAETMVLDSQMFANPKAYNRYNRTVEGDVEAFLAGSGSVDTINDIETRRFGVSIPYILYKDYQWVEGDFGKGIVARSWIDQVNCNGEDRDGNNCLALSFSTDVWYQPVGSTGLIRFTATWNLIESPTTDLIAENIQFNSLASGMFDVFTETDLFITEGGLD